MKIKFLIASLIVFFSFQVNNLSAKILPPGTGTQADVPSNLLILLDKSGSMGWRMQNAQAMNYPYDTVTDSSGNIYVMQNRTYGIKKLNYADGKVDTSWGSNGVVGRSGSCRTYNPYGATVDNGIIYVVSFNDHKIRKIRMSDGKCLGTISLKRYSYPKAIEIHNGHMYVATNKGLYSRNMSTGNYTYCARPTGSAWYQKYAYQYSYALAGSGNYLYSFYYYRLFRGTLTSANNGKNLCPTSVVNGFYNKFGYSVYGISAHPSNANELYISARNKNKIYKVTVNANGTGGTINWSKGRYGYNKVSSVTQTYFYYPWGIHYDEDNDRIVVAGYSGKKIQVFDDNGDFLKQFGGAAATTRMSAAHKAIKAIVTGFK